MVMKEKSLTSSLQSLHKRQSEYYVKLEKRLSEEEKLSQRTVTSVFHKILVSLIDELKRKYSNCRYQDASFQEYGFGATMVTIK